MTEIKLTINGKKCSGNSSETILEIARRNGINIPTLCHDESVAHYGACGLCVVECVGSPKLLRSCSTLATDGMIINTEGERAVHSRKIALELLMSDHDGDCVGPCRLACPAETDCQGYIKQVALGNTREAVRIVKQKLPLPASIGHVCPHPCERECRRNLIDKPLNILSIKRYMALAELGENDRWIPSPATSTGKTVGIIGGGPAGLTAAYYLQLKGHEVTITDSMPLMGGMLRYGIPQYRLPKEVLDAEIAEITSTGIKMENGIKVGKDISFEKYRSKYDAVIIAIGAWTSTPLGCPGSNSDGVYSGIDFLRSVALGKSFPIGKNVAIVGGGNTAMDACRTAVRLGANNVYVVYRRTMDEMPASTEEIVEASEEGVVFKYLSSPVEILCKNGNVSQLKLQKMELGSPDASGRRSAIPVDNCYEYLEVDTIISAIGQKVDTYGIDVKLNNRGIIATDESTFQTNLDGVFAVGDATNRGTDIAIAAIGEARKAADVIDSYLRGMTIAYHKPFVSSRSVSRENFVNREKKQRLELKNRPAEIRKNDFDPINIGFTKEEAMLEASRCLECGCHDYQDCALIRHSNRYEIHPERFVGEKRHENYDKTLVVIERNNGKCILCGLCVRVCDEVAHQGLLGLIGRGFGTVIKPEFQNTDVTKICKTCHKCVNSCPTGALRIIE